MVVQNTINKLSVHAYICTFPANGELKIYIFLVCTLTAPLGAGFVML